MNTCLESNGWVSFQRCRPSPRVALKATAVSRLEAYHEGISQIMTSRLRKVQCVRQSKVGSVGNAVMMGILLLRVDVSACGCGCAWHATAAASNLGIHGAGHASVRESIYSGSAANTGVAMAAGVS